MPKHPRDITASSLKRLRNTVKLDALQISAPEADPFASGLLHFLHPSDGIRVALASLSGQRGYTAEVAAEAGIVIEIRLAGISDSRELDGGSRSFSVKAEDLLITGAAHDTKWLVKAPPQARFEAISVKFSPEYLKHHMEEAPEICHWAMQCVATGSSYQCTANLNLLNLANRLLAIKGYPEPGRDYLVHAMCMQLLYFAWQAHHRRNRQADNLSSDREIVEFVQRVIDENPKSELTVAEIARLARMSATSLSATFKDFTGQSIGAAIVETRMRKGLELLESGVPVSRTSQLLGYGRPEAFSKAFRRFFGCSPRQVPRQK